MKLLRWILIAVLVVLIGLAAWLWDPLPRNPSFEALTERAALYDAEVIRDNWGVPHIYGARDADVAFALAYAHAEDDFETIQETLAATRGVLARYKGADAAVTDYLVGLFGVWDTIEAKYETGVTPEVKALAEAYVAGLNLYAAEHPDATWKGLAPFTAEDVIAGFIFKTPFFYGFDDALLELFADERTAQIALAPTPDRDAWMVGPRTAPERGSNAIAVAPQRSGDGVTRLLINSHQPMTGPVAWWEAHLVSEEGLDITGGLFPGTPVILHGFNKDLGWANTVSAQDLADVYVLERNPDNDMQYRLDGDWRDFEVSTVTIPVKLWGPFVYSAKRRVLRSEHGPVVEAPHGTYAVRYAGMGEVRQLEQYYDLNRARSLEEFMQAMAQNALPSINYLYADKDGHIAFIHNGQYPTRDNNWDWSGDLPGDRSDLIWEGYRPYEDAPMLVDPVSGVVFNANNQPYSATDGPDNLQPEDFPQSMGLQTNETNRSLRLIELVPQYPVLDRTALLEIKFDTAYATGSEADQVITAVLAQDWSADPQLAAAAEHLAAWDRHMAADSRHAALGGLTVLRDITERFTKIPAPEPSEAFRQAVDYLITHHGRIDPTWGDVNRLVRGEVNLPLDGGPDTLRAIYPAEVRDDGYLHATAGDTWIALVEWAEDGTQSADVIHQFGNATLDETSPHYADQAPLFAEMKWREALLSREAVEANASCTYRPGSGSFEDCRPD
ncbi:MAG: acylase [Henriciella sp.]|nr:acylase [Henriciella sp.]